MKSLNSIVVSFFLVMTALPIASFSQATQSTQSPILIGQSADRSGPLRDLGLQKELGIRLYFDSVNSRGGIYGRPLRLITRDDAGQTSRARENTLNFITSDNVFALLGYVGTDTSLAAMPIFSYYGIPFIGAASGSDLLRVPFNRYVFNTRAGFLEEAASIVEQMTSTGITKIAVFYQSDAHGLGGLEAISDALEKRSLKIVARGSINPNSTDAGGAVYLINRARPDAVILFCGARHAVAFIREMRRQGSTAQFYNTSQVDSATLIRELGADAHGLVISQVVPHPARATLPLVREYLSLLRAKGGSPSYASMEGYIAARILGEGLKRVGPNPTREKLVEALENLGNYDMDGLNLRFSPTNHNGGTYIDLTIINAQGKLLH